ncbi:MAG TPA: chromate efflux transporter [Steroidobacteraceae bacterium]|nr:chromate efflux transporter [Steroidobacteraceae bacterium]
MTAIEVPREAPIPFREALRFWLKLGFISFGGPAGQIAVMHQELVERRRWISERRFLHALNYCMLLPGPEAQQLATYIGWLMHRTWGGIVAGGLFVLPALAILTALSWAYSTYGDTELVTALFFGVKPAVVVVVAFAAYRIGKRVLHNGTLFTIALAAFVALFEFNVPFPLIIVSAALIGFLGDRMAPERFRTGGAHEIAATAHAPAIIDDDTPAPAHAQFRWPHALLTLVIGLLLWLGGMAALVLLQTPSGTLPTMGLFFTKAAFLTFGGAYAVLPYVYQGAVSQYRWLTPRQMIDGLALGETTPGPLIMVVAFVGYVGAWTHAVPSTSLPVAGLFGGLCATYFTFLPSFLLILVGAPIVEGTRGNLKFSAPLTSITAAVALFRFKVGIIPVVLASAVVGIALSFWRTMMP